MSLQVKYAILTNQGLIRTTNEDIIEAGVLDKVDTVGRQVTLQYMLVCDGMGGMKAGETASRVASVSLVDYLQAMPYWPTLESDIQNQMYLATMAAHQNIKMLSDYDYDKNGMATTLVLLILVNNVTYITWSGDSRAYVLSNQPKLQVGLYQDGLTLLTKDHVLVWEMVEKGMLTIDQARNHPQANMLLQSLGGKDVPNPEFITFPVYEGDRILVCTDGVNLHLNTKEIKEILASEKDINKAVNTMKDQVLKYGAKDNFSIGIIDVVGVQWSQPDLSVPKEVKITNSQSALRWLWLIPICVLAYFGWQQYNMWDTLRDDINLTIIPSADIDTNVTHNLSYQDSLVTSLQYLNTAMDSLNKANLQWVSIAIINLDSTPISVEKPEVLIVKKSVPQNIEIIKPKPTKKGDHKEKAKAYDDIYKKVELHFYEVKNKYADPDIFASAYLIRLEQLMFEIKQKKKENDFTNLTKTQWQIEYFTNKFDMFQTKYQPK